MNTHTKIDGNSEIDRLKLVMKTGTLPSLRELNKHFLPDHITRLRPLALELEVAILQEQKRPYTRSGFPDFFAAKLMEHKTHNDALRRITDIRYKIQWEAYRILRSEYGIIFPDRQDCRIISKKALSDKAFANERQGISKTKS